MAMTSSGDGAPPVTDKASDAPTSAGHAPPSGKFWALALGSVGVVFGDIGTSPLYAFKESIAHVQQDGTPATREEVIGVISLMVWSLVIVVLAKYVLLLLRLDNHGEGGTLSLMARVQKAVGRRTPLLFVLALCAAGMFYGDALLTPAVSVLSAVEGLKTIPQLEGRIEPFILPIVIGIIVALFLVQKRGTKTVGTLFGPICLVWFLTLAGLGVYHVVLDGAEILAALSPHHGVAFLTTHSVLGFVVLGSVFLTVTGAEALYADMGHFGRKPISVVFVWLVLPALALNYLGQGAMILASPEKAGNPFFLMAPDFLLAPLVGLATLATIVASQAVISGAFSLTQQAIQLGFLPRLRIVNTSEENFGQIYMPQINYMLMTGVVILVLLFKSSSALASAYGVSVIGTMITSSILAFIAVRRIWKLSRLASIALVTPFLLAESVFLASNLLKLPTGGYVPLLIASALILIMWTWVRGARELTARTRGEGMTMEDVLAGLKANPPHTVKGTAVFLTADSTTAPGAFLHNLKHNKVMHEKNLILTVRAGQQPVVPDAEKIEISEIEPGFKRMVMTFGFMETPNVSYGLALAKKQQGLTFDIMSTSFFLTRRSLVADGKIGMPIWQDHLFIFLNRNATNATEFFRIPTTRVVELGSQIAI
jgi:KUP system potassium uptake protein